MTHSCQVTGIHTHTGIMNPMRIAALSKWVDLLSLPAG